MTVTAERQKTNSPPAYSLTGKQNTDQAFRGFVKSQFAPATVHREAGIRHRCLLLASGKFEN